MKNFKERLVLLLTVLNLATFLSIRYIWSGIMNVVGGKMWIILVLLILLLVAFIISLIDRFLIKKLGLWISSLVISLLFVFLFLYMFYETLDYMIYFAINFARIIFVFLTLYAIIYAIFYMIKKPEHKKSKVRFHTGLLVLTICVSLFKVLDLGVMYFVTKPVVYAVEDEYQIVFETSRLATAEVKVGDSIYYDTSSGTIKSSSKIHKIIVPMKILDFEKQYEVSSTNILYRGPYNGVKGRTITHASTFRGVDPTGGPFKFHVGSDFHDKKKSRIASIKYEWEELDFIVLAGDISSFLETKWNISFINQCAYEASNGEIPVIYNRGNHETKGLHRDELANAVGSKNNDFYFTVTLGEIFIIVLDLAEDHNDDWWEFYGTANYSAYRRKQISWLEKIKDDVDHKYMWQSYAYRYVISHQPLSFINEDKNGLFLEEEKTQVVNLLNDMQIDASFAGHFHNLYYLHDLPSGDLVVAEGIDQKHFSKGTGANFPEFVTSKHALEQLEPNSKIKNVYTSLRVEISPTKNIAYFVNSEENIVDVIEPISGLKHSIIEF